MVIELLLSIDPYAAREVGDESLHEELPSDIHEIHNTLGIEAAVNVLYSELKTTISFDGTYVDPRHIMMIVNTQTRRLSIAVNQRTPVDAGYTLRERVRPWVRAAGLGCRRPSAIVGIAT